MILLVCGSRGFGKDANGKTCLAHFHLMNGVLRPYLAHSGLTIIHGGAQGADDLAGRWALKNKVPTIVFPAKWNLHGKAAGPIRNTQMLVEGKPDEVVAFWDQKSKGTADMIKQARRALGEDRVYVSIYE